MTLITAAIQGNLEAAMKAEIRDVAAGMRRAVTRAAEQTQEELRRQAGHTGFRDGGRSLANAWRMRVFPGAGKQTLHPAAMVWSKMPDVAEAFDSGKTIHVKRRKYLCFPTGYNRTGSRKGRFGGMRIQPSQMIGAQSFVIRSKRDRTVKLWCLRVREGTRGKVRKSLAVVVRNNTYVATGHVKGRQQRMRDILKRGFVPMFFLIREVTPGKRLDIDAARRKSVDLAVAAMVAELR